MTEINFKSTFRIPITQAGINNAKKAKLKALVESYPGGLVGTSKVGNARVSIPNSEDANFIKKLKTIGYKIFQQFEGENIKSSELDDFIKTNLDSREFKQFGKQKPAKSSVKPKKNFAKYEQEEIKQTPEATITKQEKKPAIFVNKEKNKSKQQNEIRQSESYKDIVARYGEEAAEAIFFFSRKKK